MYCHKIIEYAALHRAKNILWGVWSNAASDSEITEYLAKWALLEDAELAIALAYAKSLNWEMMRRFIGIPGRADRMRRLLAEQLLPSALRDCYE